MVIYYDSANDSEERIEDDAVENALAEEVEVRSFLDLMEACYPNTNPRNLVTVYVLSKGGNLFDLPKAFADLLVYARRISQCASCLPHKNVKVRHAVQGINEDVDKIQRGLVGIVLALGIGRATSKKL